MDRTDISRGRGFRWFAWRLAGGLAFVVPFLAVAMFLQAVSGCDAKKEPVSERSEVVIYCSADVAFAKPLLEAFEDRTGIKVHYVSDTEAGKTTGLVNKLLAESKSPRADVWWSSEIFGTMQLASRGILTPYEPSTAKDIPARYRDPAKLWTAFGLRGRVIAYDPKRSKAEDLPQCWADVTAPKYKGKFGLADPRFGTTRGHMATQLLLWGEEAMTDYYTRLSENEYRLTDGNSNSVLLLTRGVLEFVATDTDDVIVAQQRGDSVAMYYPNLDAPNGGRKIPGTLWIPNSVGMVKGGPNPEPAHKLIDYIASAELEERLYKSDSRNMPVRRALREQLGAELQGESNVDYAGAAAVLERSDKLIGDVLLK